MHINDGPGHLIREHAYTTCYPDLARAHRTLLVYFVSYFTILQLKILFMPRNCVFTLVAHTSSPSCGGSLRVSTWFLSPPPDFFSPIGVQDRNPVVKRNQLALFPCHGR